jgi:chemotaxis protein MotB
MKTYSYFLIFCIGSLSLGSCIAPQKFANIQAENSENKKRVAELESKNAELLKNSDTTARHFLLVQELCSSQLLIAQKQLDSVTRKLQKNEKLLASIKKEARLDQEEMNHMQQDISRAVQSFSPDELSVDMRDGELYLSLSDKLLFPTGSDAINPRGKKALKVISKVLRKTNMLIMVEGHTDAVPINNRMFKDNWDLSVHRATSVTRVLTSNGIKPSRIIASGRSQFRPIASNKNETGRKYNRRTEVVLLPRLDILKNLLSKDMNAFIEPATDDKKSAMK